jgi:hypothetical protein
MSEKKIGMFIDKAASLKIIVRHYMFAVASQPLGYHFPMKKNLL